MTDWRYARLFFSFGSHFLTNKWYKEKHLWVELEAQVLVSSSWSPHETVTLEALLWDNFCV